MEKLSTNIEENKQYLQSQFENAMDFMMRELELSGTKAALFASRLSPSAFLTR